MTAAAILAGIVIIISATVVCRALACKAMPAKAAVSGDSSGSKPVKTLDIDADGAAARLSALIQKRTVSSPDPQGWDKKEFESFRALLPKLYPRAHKVLELTLVGGHSMLYRWKGGAAENPLVLLAHYDVVPASDDGWIRPPFSGDIFEGKVWGRGSIDTKCTLVCALEAVETLAKDGFLPACDIYLSFGHDEESGSEGAAALVEHLASQGVKPGLVLDEGGAVVSGVFPGVSKPLAMVGVAEKGVTNIELMVKSAGGHSATPPKKDAVWALARAITRLGARPFPARFPAATTDMFKRLAPHASFGLRLVMANLWLFKPLLLKVFSSAGGELNAVCRTTAVVTMLGGSDAANVLPAQAKAVVNVRIAVDGSVDAVMARMAKVMRDPLVEMKLLLRGEPSPVSVLDGDGFALLSKTIGDVYPEAVLTPYVVLGGTDARFYSKISSAVYRFSPFELSREERESMHAINEAIPMASLAKGVEFYLRLIGRICG